MVDAPFIATKIKESIGRNKQCSIEVAPTLFVACVMLLMPMSAFGADYSVFGAETLPAGRYAAYATVGLPDLEVGASFGLNSVADVTPRVRLQYGRGTRIGGGGLALGASLRMKIARTSAWSIALVSQPEVSLHLWGKDHPPTTTTSIPALAISPFAAGVVADRVVLEDVRVTAGIKVPLTFYMRPEWVMNVPLIAEIGVESKVADNILLLARIDTGVDFYGPGGLPGTAAYFRLRAGLAWSK